MILGRIVQGVDIVRFRDAGAGAKRGDRRHLGIAAVALDPRQAAQVMKGIGKDVFEAELVAHMLHYQLPYVRPHTAFRLSPHDRQHVGPGPGRPGSIVDIVQPVGRDGLTANRRDNQLNLALLDLLQPRLDNQGRLVRVGAVSGLFIQFLDTQSAKYLTYQAGVFQAVVGELGGNVGNQIIHTTPLLREMVMAITWVSRRLEQVVGGLRSISVVDTRIEHFTADLCDILGYSPETLKGAWLSELEHPDDRWQGKVNAYLRHIGERAAQQYVVRWQNHGGDWVYLRKRVSATAFINSWMVHAEVIKEGDFKAPEVKPLDEMGIDITGWIAYNGRYDQRTCVEILSRANGASGIADNPDLDTFNGNMILSEDTSEKYGRLYRSRQTGRTRRQYVCHRCGWGWMSQSGRKRSPTQCPECNSVIWWKTENA